MCKAENQGGQRCAAHTRKALGKAQDAAQAALTDYREAISYDMAPAVLASRAQAHAQTSEDLFRAHVEHASTPTGQRELEAALAKATAENDAAEIMMATGVLQRGAELRDRNKVLAEALKAAEQQKEARNIAAAAGDHSPPTTTTEDLVTLDQIEPGESFEWGGDVHVMDTMDEDDPDDYEVRTAGGMHLLIPKGDLVDRLGVDEEDRTGWEETFEERTAGARADEAEVTGAAFAPAPAKPAMPATVKLSEDDFCEQYVPIDQTSINLDGNTYWDEPPTDLYPEDRIWTVVENGENDNQYLIPGINYVNRMGYIASEKPWTDSNIEVLWFDHDNEMGN